MRTAEEMYEYCRTNEMGTGATKGWTTKHFRVIEQALQPDEEVLICFSGLYLYENNNGNYGFYAYAVTNKRILFGQQHMVGYTLKTVEIENLNDITCSAGMVSGFVTIDTLKERFTVKIGSIAAKNINEKIHNLLHDLKQSRTSSGSEVGKPVSSAADEILKYKNLLDMGAITHDEFMKKKKELLNL